MPSQRQATSSTLILTSYVLTKDTVLAAEEFNI
jgi:hypothetical protein